MKIKTIKIKNFKSIIDIEIECNPSFNVIIGQNNIGKTTILEAILLWKKCFDKNVQVKGKKFYSNAKNIRFEELTFLRITDDVDLFNTVKNKKADAEIELEFIDDGTIYRLGFKLSKVYNIDNAYFQISYIQKDEFVRFETVTDKYNEKLKNIIAISESRPIANIITKEPYMYKGQIVSKIDKGKGFEVLRNKIISNKETKSRIEEYVSNILGENFVFVEREKDNKEYIKLMVQKENELIDILSQGSGFLQITEIFSSLEYLDAKLYILLIDEPDSHIHSSLQKKLIDEIKAISNSQLFVISHNEGFIDEVEDEEILFINEKDKLEGLISPLEKGAKRFVVENLIGELKDIDQLKYAEKIVLVEGDGDKSFLEELSTKYQQITKNDEIKMFSIVLNGIDSLSSKLNALSLGYECLVTENQEWILLRDTDCIPISYIEELTAKIKNQIYYANKSVVFQNGYALESVIVSEKNKFNSLLKKYYSNDNIVRDEVIDIVNAEYATNIKDITTSIHEKIKAAFDSQMGSRQEGLYKKLTLKGFISEINSTNIQYIMTKDILDDYLSDIHDKIIGIYNVQDIDKLTNKSIMEYYIDNLYSIDDFYDFHLMILEKLYGYSTEL